MITSHRQRQLNYLDKKIILHINKGVKSPISFSLYLRTFEVDGKFVYNSEHYPHDVFGHEIVRVGSESLERIITEALSRKLQMVALGANQIDVTGVGLAGYIDNWTVAVSRLVNSAQLIVVIQSANAGALWEIEHICCSGALFKTEFVMPPTVGPFLYAERNCGYSSHWKEACDKIRVRTGLILPSFDPNGAIMRYEEKSEGFRRTPFPPFMKFLHESFEELGFSLTPCPQYVLDIMQAHAKKDTETRIRRQQRDEKQKLG